MRRSDRQINDPAEIFSVLTACDTVRLAFAAEGAPYIVPLSFGAEQADGVVRIYVHGAREGRRHTLAAAGGRVGIEADRMKRFVPTADSLTCEYESVIGTGTIRLLEGEEAIHALQLLVAHCGYPEIMCKPETLKITSVWCIETDDLTGKRRTVR